MYPANYFSLYQPFPRDNTVFVAMSFDNNFDKRWHKVIAPGIRNVKLRGKSLEPIRVDSRKISESILIEIMSNISNCRVFFADITAQNQAENSSYRNGNVMYEVGLAHAVRLPEEVLLFRSDNDDLLFDVANVRINLYAPDEEPEKAKNFISDTIISAIKEIDLRRHIAVSKAAESLDLHCLYVLAEAQSRKGISHPEMTSITQTLANISRIAAINRLLELGAIRSIYLSLTPEKYSKIKDSNIVSLLTYVSTEFGSAVFEESARRMGLSSPEMEKVLEKEYEEK